MNAKEFLKELAKGNRPLVGDDFKNHPIIGQVVGGLNDSAWLSTEQQRFVIELLANGENDVAKIATYINSCH